VVAAKQEEVLRVLDLVRKQEADNLKALLPSVHVIAQEEVVCVGWEATVIKQTQKIVVLPVDIAYDLDGSLEFQQHGLCKEHFSCGHCKPPDLSLCEVHLAAGLAALDLEQL